MKKKYRIKKSAANAYSALSGKEATQLSGSIDCLVAEHLTTTLKNKALNKSVVVPIAKYAYHLYTKTPLEKIKKVTQSCGVDQCVKQDHLVAELTPEVPNHGWG